MKAIIIKIKNLFNTSNKTQKEEYILKLKKNIDSDVKKNLSKYDKVLDRLAQYDRQ